MKVKLRAMKTRAKRKIPAMNELVRKGGLILWLLLVVAYCLSWVELIFCNSFSPVKRLQEYHALALWPFAEEFDQR